MSWNFIWWIIFVSMHCIFSMLLQKSTSTHYEMKTNHFKFNPNRNTRTLHAFKNAFLKGFINLSQKILTPLLAC